MGKDQSCGGKPLSASKLSALIGEVPRGYPCGKTHKQNSDFGGSENEMTIEVGAS